MMHSNKIKRRAPKWQYSYFFFAGFIITSLAGFIGGTQKGSALMWIFENMQMPMSSTMFSLLAFYMASAAYKAFRARSAEATVLLIAAIVVMLAQVPLGVNSIKIYRLCLNDFGCSQSCFQAWIAIGVVLGCGNFPKNTFGHRTFLLGWNGLRKGGKTG